MRTCAGIFVALLVASCRGGGPQPAEAPVPVRDAAPQPVRPSAPPTDTATRPSVQPSDGPKADSAALVAAARDSALDAAMLDRIAAAKPPAGTELSTAPAEGESATLRSMFDIDVANFEDHGRVRFWVDFFSGPARERMAIWLQRMPQFEPTFRAKLIAKGLPGDLAYLPLIESGYSPTAVSRARAVGMWQFMRATGRYYGLTVDSWVDDRRDVVKATDAAVRYLADLTKRFGSPYLAAAAYNGGPGRISRGLNRLDIDLDLDEEEEVDSAVVGLDSLPPDTSPQAGDMAFFQLAGSRYIRQETKDYVPKLIAAAIIAKQPERYGFPVPMGGPLDLDSVVVTDATGLDVIAGLAGMTLAEVRELNPHFLRELTPPKRTTVVRLPDGKGETTSARLLALPASERLGSFPHRARTGETLAALGRKYGVTLAAMKAANPEVGARGPARGDVIRIPGEARLKGWVAENRKVNTTEVLSGGTTHRVRKGETLGGIAKRYRVTVTNLRRWNGLETSRIRVGQVLRLRPGRPSAVAPVTSSAGGVSSRTHLVRTGDTLTSIARRYGTTIQAIRTANGLSSRGAIQAGQRLKIPS